MVVRIVEGAVMIKTVGDSFLLSDICRNTGLHKQTVNSAIRKLESESIIYLEVVDGKARGK